ncbi:hypothetical protein [Xenorhabdus taiwanensis]|uniref:Uncharacterized protein n=1 Tax=Xenorhabdus taiwanensis TaxID=3085177 RepID=A0ABN7C5N4_9GAMM|nr:hypothetical protein TCT1_25650 [Xenorhabdus sp. TCT-1]
MKPELIIEKINGYLEAFGILNMACNRGSDYYFMPLPEKPQLIDSLYEYFLSISDKYPAEHWNPELEIAGKDNLIKAIQKWFFEADFFKNLPEETASDAIDGLLKLLTPFITTAPIYKMNITPPVWYACHWDDFVIDSKSGRFLLSFGCHD